mmetsp:Transcript_16176/g.15895  ORF Transcript_16176/g.15895 Transcript_16176/m.15895 type:complete len:524 (-) Transcript_16176:6-1577(-)
MARTSSSQERKLLNTPKRNENKVFLQRQIIKPDNTLEVTPLKPTETNKTIEEDKNEDKEPPQSILDEMRNVGRATSTSILVGRSIAKTMADKPPLNFKSSGTEKDKKPTQEIKVNYLFMKPDQVSTEVKPENSEKKDSKPTLSIFGTPSQDVLNELKNSRACHNSSPVFGESKNEKTDSTEKTAEKEIKKPTALFTQKITPIVEAPEEDGGQEEKETTSVKAPSLFQPKPTIPKKVGSDEKHVEEKKQEEEKKPEDKKPLFGAKPGSSSLFSGSSAPSSTSLFQKPAEEKPEEKKPAESTSLFNKPSTTYLFSSKIDPLPNLDKKLSSAGGNPFLAKNLSSGSAVNLFSGAKPTNEGPKNLFSDSSSKPPKESSSLTIGEAGTSGLGQTQKPSLFSSQNSEDVGMGGTTPPTLSGQKLQKEEGSLFAFQNPQRSAPSTSLFGGQGNSGASQSQGPLFGSQSSSNAFSIGPAKEKKSLFGANSASDPNQGQPALNKTSSWAQPIFSGVSKPKKKDDGLFSDTKR